MLPLDHGGSLIINRTDDDDDVREEMGVNINDDDDVERPKR